MIEVKSKVKYVGIDTSVLMKNETYTIFQVLEGGVRVYIPTGFCGISTANFEVVK